MNSRSLLLVGLVLVFVPALLARRSNRRQEWRAEKAAHSENCGNWTYGPCVLKNKEASCGVGKKLATPGNENCPLKSKLVKCKVHCEPQQSDCRYKKQSHADKDESACDPVTNKQAVTLKRISGDADSCPATKVVHMPCRKRQIRAAGGKVNKKVAERERKGHKQGATGAVTTIATTTPAVIPAGKNNAECKYRKSSGDKAPCDPVTNTRTIVKELKKNQPASCEPTKSITETCKQSKRKQGGQKKAGRKPQ